MFAENRKHLALVVRAQVEKTVPREHAVKAPIQRQVPHVRNYPVLAWELGFADADEVFGRVHPRHIISVLNEITPNRVS
jgi:hypothetical protein